MLLTALVASTLCACSLFVASADREVNRLLDARMEQVDRHRAATMSYPTELLDQEQGGPAREAGDDDAPPGDKPSAQTPEIARIDLPHALALAFASSPDYLDSREALYQQGLGFTLTRHNFGPQLNGTISYIWTKSKDGVPSDSQTTSVGASQILPTGGTLSVSSGLFGSREDDPNLLQPYGRFAYNLSAGFSVNQPLLRGAGYAISHEALTQGQRSLIYAVRSFELFRQDLAIRIAQAYYDLVSQKATLANDRQNRDDAVFDREKAEALRLVDRNKDDDVFLARRREIDAEDALLVSETSHKLALDDFKILLGLPTSTRVVIEESPPPFEPVRLEPESAVEAALHNRLDLLTQRDQLEDVARQVNIARNNLLPSLDATADVAYTGDTARMTDASLNTWTASVGLNLEIPVDRKAERNAYRSALLTLGQAKRNFDQRLAEIERDILAQLRELTQIEKRIDLQTEQIKQEQRAVAVTRIRYESGDVDNRDLLDARQGLNNAQNALIDLKVRHFVARLRLFRNMGILMIDNQGMWQL